MSDCIYTKQEIENIYKVISRAFLLNFIKHSDKFLSMSEWCSESETEELG